MLEGAEDGIATATGMAAVSACFMTFLSAGDHIISASAVFGSTHTILTKYLPKWGIEFSYFDMNNPEMIETLIKSNTKVLYVETPSNPGLDIIDLTYVSLICKKHNIIFIVDNCFATPAVQQPILFGADLVLHSATKAMAGHNDATLGVIAGEKDLIDAIWSYAVLHGATASPYDAVNGLRGIRTLGVRLAHQCTTAMELASRLVSNPSVSAVHYPGLSTHPQHALAAKQMRQFGSLLSFEVVGGKDAARKVIDGLKLVRPAVSLGGPETLICHPASSTHVGVSPEDQLTAGITQGLLRVSVGLESATDVIADFQQVLASL